MFKLQLGRFVIADKEAKVFAVARKHDSLVYRDLDLCLARNRVRLRQRGLSDMQIEERLERLREMSRKGPAHPDNLDWDWYITPAQQFFYALGVFLGRPLGFDGVLFSQSGRPLGRPAPHSSIGRRARSLF